MKKSTLIMWSGIRDGLDIIGIGQIPGLNWVLSAPILLMHLSYAGPVALFTLLEAIPVVGFIPIFTVAAMAYPDRDAPSGGGSAATAVRAQRSELPEPQETWSVRN